jgi:hypothetical protein
MIDVQRTISVFGALKWGFARSGVKKLFAHFEATVILESWPSFAGHINLSLEIHRMMDKELLTHVWGHEKPLRKRVVGQVLLERHKVFGFGRASWYGRNRIVNDQRADWKLGNNETKKVGIHLTCACGHNRSGPWS